MTASITTNALIRRSLLLINAIGAEQNIKATLFQDCLETLNELLDDLSTETISVYGSDVSGFPLVPTQAIYTIGTGGDFDVPRPVYVRDVYCLYKGISTPVKVISQVEYDNLSLKTQADSIIRRLLYVNSYPLGKIIVWPVPNDATAIINMSLGRVLTNITNGTTLIDLPPGYLRMLRYLLAVELWPEFSNSETDITTIKAIAISAKEDVSVANQVDYVATFEDVPASRNAPYWSGISY